MAVLLVLWLYFYFNESGKFKGIRERSNLCLECES